MIPGPIRGYDIQKVSLRAYAMALDKAVVFGLSRGMGAIATGRCHDPSDRVPRRRMIGYELNVVGLRRTPKVKHRYTDRGGCPTALCLWN